MSRRRRCSLGSLSPSQALRARRLCRVVQTTADPEVKVATCRRLVEALSEFGHEDPAARIRARACGCPMRG
jgi:Glu-tRNA(Gln) amidotransferase subunit E-like FAD-binding protein